jgi:hypothetical protein
MLWITAQRELVCRNVAANPSIQIGRLFSAEQEVKVDPNDTFRAVNYS